MKLFTIGTAQKTAEEFFRLVESAGVRRIVDVRLHNSSQLAGWTKRPDFAFILRRVAGLDYLHLPELLAPTEEILSAYKKEKGSWAEYEREFTRLLRSRPLGELLSKGAPGDEDRAVLADSDCLVCSEPSPAHCHRRIIAEELRALRPAIEIIHL